MLIVRLSELSGNTLSQSTAGVVDVMGALTAIALAPFYVPLAPGEEAASLSLMCT